MKVRSIRGLFLAEALVTVDDIDFDFENSQVRVVVTREIPETPRSPTKLKIARVGQETEVPYWVARELVQLGYARFREEDTITYNSLSKMHWRETIPSSRQLPSLPGNYYCIMRRHLRALREQSKQDQIKLRELEKTETLVRDIISCRVRKIVSIAASPTPSEELIQGLTFEERSLYRMLNGTIEEWKAKIFGQDLKA
ncbi:MAG: hypothetical protein ACLPY5_13915 [Candidatus Bathyarchaeia archaeon]